MAYEIKVGEMAVIKMTGEPVFVLRQGDFTLDPFTCPLRQGFSGVVEVRRAVESQAGLSYQNTCFYLEELENFELRRKKQYAEFMEMAGQANVVPDKTEMAN